MEYDEIIKLEDLQERRDKMIEYYTDFVGVNEWLINENNQIINFKDRVEYKINNKYHRLNGPAIEYKDGPGEFYINGKEYMESEWKPIATNILRELKLKRTLKNK